MSNFFGNFFIKLDKQNVVNQASGTEAVENLP